MTTALDGAIKRGAEGIGAWWNHSKSGAAVQGYADVPHIEPEGWSIGPAADGRFVIRFSRGIHVEGQAWDVEALTAAVHVLLLEAGHTIERPCPECRGRCETTTKLPPRQADGAEWLIAPCAACMPPCDECTNGLADFGNGDVRDCPRCEGGGRLDPTGRVHVEAARVLLEALCRSATAWELGAKMAAGGVESFEGDADTQTRADLQVLADALMSPLPRGTAQEPAARAIARHKLGHVLALWLAGELTEEHVMGVAEREVDCRDTEAEGLMASSVDWVCHGGTFPTDPGGRSTSIWRRPVLEARPS